MLGKAWLVTRVKNPKSIVFFVAVSSTVHRPVFRLHGSNGDFLSLRSSAWRSPTLSDTRPLGSRARMVVTVGAHGADHAPGLVAEPLIGAGVLTARAA